MRDFLAKVAIGYVLAMVVASAPVTASRAAPAYSVWQMSCRQARAVVAAQGAVVMYTAPASARGPETYERFVQHSGHCMAEEGAEPAWAPARDEKTCFVGYRCVRLDLPMLPSD